MKLTLPAPRKIAAAVAMSDVAFLLLIFLVVTVTVEEEGSVSLPSFAYTIEMDITEPVTLQINKTGNLFYGDIPMGEDQLINYLAVNKEKDSVLRIFADKNLFYSEIDKLLNRLKEKGFSRIILVTEKEYENR